MWLVELVVVEWTLEVVTWLLVVVEWELEVVVRLLELAGWLELVAWLVEVLDVEVEVEVGLMLEVVACDEVDRVDVLTELVEVEVDETVEDDEVVGHVEPMLSLLPTAAALRICLIQVP